MKKIILWVLAFTFLLFLVIWGGIYFHRESERLAALFRPLPVNLLTRQIKIKVGHHSLVVPIAAIQDIRLSESQGFSNSPQGEKPSIFAAERIVKEMGPYFEAESLSLYLDSFSTEAAGGEKLCASFPVAWQRQICEWGAGSAEWKNLPRGMDLLRGQAGTKHLANHYLGEVTMQEALHAADFQSLRPQRFCPPVPQSESGVICAVLQVIDQEFAVAWISTKAQDFEAQAKVVARFVRAIGSQEKFIHVTP